MEWTLGQVRDIHREGVFVQDQESVGEPPVGIVVDDGRDVQSEEGQGVHRRKGGLVGAGSG